MEEVTLDGKIYISSKRAAQVTGYAKDYIGQLCREGRVEAKLVGRSWYIYEPSIRRHRFKEEAPSVAEEVEDVQEVEPVSEETNNEAVWEPATYVAEDISALPEISPKEESFEVSGTDEIEETIPTNISEPEKTNSHKVSEMQSAWQEWFSSERAAGTTEREEVPTEEAAQPVTIHKTDEEPQYRPQPPVLYDIQPKRQSYSPLPVRTVVKGKTQQDLAKPKGNLAVNAVFVAIILITISFAVAASGFTEKFIQSGPLEDFLMILGGASVIEK